MCTDNKFQNFLSEHLEEEIYDDVLKLYNDTDGMFYAPTMLTVISVTKLSANILTLIKQFLESLPIEEASEYVTKFDNYGQSALFICKDVNLLQIIIKYIPNINIRNAYNMNALICACASEMPLNLEKIKFLLDHKIDVNVQREDEMLAPLACCCYAYRSYFKENIDNTLDAEFHNGARKNIEEAIELLIFNGADIFAKSADGMTAYDIVKDINLLSERLAQLLQGIIKLNGTKKAPNIKTSTCALI